VRETWLERLFDALQADRMPYIEYLGDFWGQLCVMPSIASAWEWLLGASIREIGPGCRRRVLCLHACSPEGALGAQRYDELFRLVDSARLNW
jgi:hypothetical protein